MDKLPKDNSIERRPTSAEQRAAATERRIAIATGTAFFAVLFALGILLAAGWWRSPGEEFAPAENRYLAAKTEVTAESILSGDAMDETEAFLDDHFPGREKWIEAQAALVIAGGSKENRGIYFAGNEEGQTVLIPSFKTYDRDRWERNVKAIEKFAAGEKAAGRKVYVAAVPTAPAVYRWRLPAHAPEVEQGELIAELRAKAPSATVIDVLPDLQNHARGLTVLATGDGELYFGTDHHMTQNGSYLVYREILAAMGEEALPVTAFTETVVTEEFRGTSYHKSGAFWLPGEPLTRWVPVDKSLQKRQEQAEITILPAGTEKTGLYDEEAAKTVDAYTYFLYGNQPVEVIRAGNGAADMTAARSSDSAAGSRKLLVVKDSYAHSIVPFLALHYDEIHMVDLRYYRGSLKEYREANGIDTTLVLYNLPNLAEDRDVVQIAR